jgi:predicted MPP superfamily phosphohydrolase
MDFPRAIFIFFLLLSVYLLLQGALFLRLKAQLQQRFEGGKGRLAAVPLALFFLLMLSPLSWRLLFGWQAEESYPWVVRSLFAASAIWSFGSTGWILLLLARDSLPRLTALFSARSLPRTDIGRRDFLKKGFAAASAAPFVLSGYGVFFERRRLQVDHLALPVNGLSSSLEQFSVVQLTDIHVGPFMPEEELARYVEEVNRVKPDLVALTGDFVASSPEEVAPCVRALSRLHARYGVFACMGNHDVYADVEDELTRELESRGIRVLRNDAASIRVGNTSLNVLGIDDLRWGKPDLSRALQLAAREPGEARLLLSHRPEVFPEAAQLGIEVVLSGHYHGGQVKLAPDPRALSIARLITPYAEGIFQLGRNGRSAGAGAKDSVLFVSRGVGITGLPIRINCPPQIAHLTLRKT